MTPVPWRHRGRRVTLALALACAIGVALAAFGATSALAQKAEPTRKPADNRVKALVLGKASSPVLKELKGKRGWQLTQAANAQGRGSDPSKYDVLVVDGDSLSPRQLGEGTLVDRFADANRWVLALDMDPADYSQGLVEHTGFTVGERSGKSSAFLFSRQLLNGSPRVVMVEAKSLRPNLDEEQDDQQWLSETTARQTQEVASNITRAASASRSTLEKEYAPPGTGDAIPEEAQHVGWTYGDVGSSAPPYQNYFNQQVKCVEYCDNNFRRWVRGPEPGKQTPNWTFNHYFDTYLNNDKSPQGDYQYLTYRLQGFFSPKRSGENFAQMFDPTDYQWFFCDRPDGKGFFCHSEYDIQYAERAWWTQQLGVEVRPDAKTNAQLIHEQSAPLTPNQETKYSTRQDFKVGITFSAKGVAVEGSYDVQSGEEHTIPDWGVENKGDDQELSWMFSAREPCDLRDEVNKTADCFMANYWDPRTPEKLQGIPKQPTDLSLNQLEVNAAGRWRTKGLVTEQDGKANFQIKTPTALADSFCKQPNPTFHYCEESTREVIRGAVGSNHPDFWTNYGIDLCAVNPIPIKSFTLAPNPANGAKNDKVTGTVVLERPTQMDVRVKVYSNSKNATVGVPDGSGESSTMITIPKGETRGTFQALTSDDNLKPGEHATATFTAFYAKPYQEQLRVESPNKPAGKSGKPGGGNPQAKKARR